MGWFAPGIVLQENFDGSAEVNEGVNHGWTQKGTDRGVRESREDRRLKAENWR